MVKTILFLILLFGTPAIACTNKDAPKGLNASDIVPLTLIGVFTLAAGAYILSHRND
jgi:hypothetical protein